MTPDEITAKHPGLAHLARSLSLRYPALSARAWRACEIVLNRHVYAPRGEFELACVRGSEGNVTYSLSLDDADAVTCSCLDHPHAPTGPRSWHWCKHMIAWRMQDVITRQAEQIANLSPLVQREEETPAQLVPQFHNEGVTAHV